MGHHHHHHHKHHRHGSRHRHSSSDSDSKEEVKAVCFKYSFFFFFFSSVCTYCTFTLVVHAFAYIHVIISWFIFHFVNFVSLFEFFFILKLLYVLLSFFILSFKRKKAFLVKS